MEIRAVAVSAPSLYSQSPSSKVLSSSEPVSIQNACRYAAHLAENDVGPWGNSNWAGNLSTRRSSVFLMHNMTSDKETFIKLITETRPNLVLIGAMTICFAGAIELAEITREALGKDVFIVLGGRHANETIGFKNQEVFHHPASPLKLMWSKKIPEVFDLTVSGEAEFVIEEIGNAISKCESGRLDVIGNINFQNIPGRWIMSYLNDGQINDFASSIRYSRQINMPSPVSVFGTDTKFGVFNGRYTAHVFSDSGNGCAFDCSFCSERRSITGGIVELSSSADRLWRQIADAQKSISARHGENSISCFCEDSTLLGGSIGELNKLQAKLSKSQIDLSLGAQFTIDQIISKQTQIQGLSKVGLDYVFVGLETPQPSLIGGLSKDVRPDQSWLSRSQNVLEILAGSNIQCGVALLFGLGETHPARMRFIQDVAKWVSEGLICTVSMNWAVQHPLLNARYCPDNFFTDWPIPPNSEWEDLFVDFGEASLLYPVSAAGKAVQTEVAEVKEAYHQLEGIV